MVLLSRDPGLASITGRLLSNGDRIAQFRSAAELSNWSTPVVAAVVLDSRPQARRLSYKQVRDRYDGPLVMLLDKGERRPDLPPDGARQFLHRPFRAAELSKLLGTPTAELGAFEAAIIAAWSRHATAEQAVKARRGASYRINWRPSLRRRARAWAATVVALMGLLLVFGLSGQSPCTPGCTNFGGAVAGAAENESPLTSSPLIKSGGSGNHGTPPPGSSGASSQPPTPTGGLPGGRRGRRADPVHQPHLHHRHQPALGPHQRRRGPGPSGHQPAAGYQPTPDHEPPGHQPAADNRSANHHPADHRPAHDGSANHRPADDGSPHHRPADDGSANHRASHHRPAHHSAPDDRTADHSPANHSTHHRRPPRQSPAAPNRTSGSGAGQRRVGDSRRGGLGSGLGTRDGVPGA